MTIIKNVSYSQKVARGDYDEAIEKLTARKYRGRETYASKTNLCVAYTKSGDLDNAQVAEPIQVGDGAQREPHDGGSLIDGKALQELRADDNID